MIGLCINSSPGNINRIWMAEFMYLYLNIIHSRANSGERKYILPRDPLWEEVKLPYDPVCPSVGRLVGCRLLVGLS